MDLKSNLRYDCFKREVDEVITSMSSVFIDGDTKAVWEALTTEEKLVKWFVPGSPWQIPVFDEGEEMVLTLTPLPTNNIKEEKKITMEIETIIPFQGFSFKISGEERTVEFLMTEVAAGITVNVNLSSYDRSLENLKAYIEGETLPHTF